MEKHSGHAPSLAQAFADLRISPEILKAIAGMGFEKPTPVQLQVIPLMLQGSDVVVQSQTGTGKTAAFAVPILQNMDLRAGLQALILVPTRELALQVTDEFHSLGKHTKFSIVTVYGGASMEVQLDALRRGANVVVATPGRLLDHMGRGTIDLSRIRTLVLDEADLMLDMGFIDDVRQIIDATPQERHTCLFSATLPPEISQLAHEYLVTPETVRINEEQLAVGNIKQEYISVDPREKVSALATILKLRNTQSAIVFTRTKLGADSLSRSLHSLGFHVYALHGNLTQSRRERVMADFHAKKFNILVATDIAARGLDIDDVELIVNYNLPEDPKVYVHRIGRTARAGKAGSAIAFCTNLMETRFIEQVAVFANSEITELKIDIDRSLRPKFSPRSHPQSGGRGYGEGGRGRSYGGGGRGGGYGQGRGGSFHRRSDSGEHSHGYGEGRAQRPRSQQGHYGGRTGGHHHPRG